MMISMRSKLGILIAGIIFIGACGPSKFYRTTPITGPDGSKHWAVIRCYPRAECLIAASSACSTGYEVKEDSGPHEKTTTLIVHCLPPKSE